MYVGEEMADIFKKNPRNKFKIRMAHIIIIILSVFMLFLAFALYGFFNSPQQEQFYSTAYGELLEMIETAQIRNPNRQPQAIDHLDLTFISIADDFAIHGSPGILAWSGADHDAHVSRAEYSFHYGDGFYAFGGMRHETPQDVFSVELSNGYSFDINVIVKLFYNYEEVVFRVLGSSEYQTEFIFTIPAFYDVHIPVQLESQLQVDEFLSSRLSVFVDFMPDLHVGEDQAFLGRITAMALNFEIDYGSTEREILLPQSGIDIFPVENFSGAGFKINQDFEPVGPSVKVPPYLLQVSSGEEIKLGFITNGNALLSSEEVESFAVISMLDFQQINMSGERFLHINTNGDLNTGEHAVFTITAPDEPGFYEFSSFIVPNPTQPLRSSNFFPLDIAMRFTIEVVE